MCMCVLYVSVFIYIRIYTISYTVIVVKISFFHRLISFKVQSCVNLNGTSRREDTGREKTFEAIVCK